MSKLSQSTIEKLGYYVYLLIDPRDGEPFYVGKGVGNRINHHLLDALVVRKDEKKKIQTVRAIQEVGLDVSLKILRHGLTEEEAFEVESAVIDYIGQNNLTNLVMGHHSTDRGLMSLDDIKIKYEAEPANFNEQAILININKKYFQGMSAEDIYEATRISWKISIPKASKVKIVCSVYRGIIREVFIIDRWLADSTRPGRSYFEGTVAPAKIRNKYIHKSVVAHIELGNQNPVKYIN